MKWWRLLSVLVLPCMLPHGDKKVQAVKGDLQLRQVKAGEPDPSPTFTTEYSIPPFFLAQLLPTCLILPHFP